MNEGVNLRNKRCDKQMFDLANQKLLGHVTYRIWRETTMIPSRDTEFVTNINIYVKNFLFYFISMLFHQMLNVVLKLYRSRLIGKRVISIVDIYLTTSNHPPN